MDGWLYGQTGGRGLSAGGERERKRELEMEKGGWCLRWKLNRDRRDRR